MTNNICNKIKTMINSLRNRYFGSINKNYLVLCDDGNGPYKKKYGQLVKELKEELAHTKKYVGIFIGCISSIGNTCCKPTHFESNYRRSNR